LDTDRRELRRGGAPVAVEPQVFDLLEYLIRNRERVVSKDDLLSAIWGGRVVSESALSSRMNAARTALGDSGEEQRLIRTLLRKGFRFIAEVREEPKSADAPTDAATDQDGIAYLQKFSRRVLPLPDKPSIAVLPFANTSGDPEHEYFADGMVDDIITALARVPWLFVIARNSSFVYKGQAVEVPRIARDLGVRYVLEGSVRKRDNRVRINCQLLEAEHATHVWANRYDRALTDIFAVQEEIADTIAGALEPEISARERDRSRRKPPEHLGAWELYQRGMWHLLQHNREHFTEAQTFFRNATELDPAFAAPHAGIALVDFFRIARALTDDPAGALAEMSREAAQAVALDPNEPLGHTALGLNFRERGEYSHSFAEHEVAIALNPNSSLARWSFGFCLEWGDRLEEALQQFELALRLSPKDPGTWSYLTLKASTLYQLGEYAQAAKCADDAIRHPAAELLWAYTYLAASLAQLQCFDEAAAAVSELLRRRPTWSLSACWSLMRNRHRSEQAVRHVLAGLRKAGLPE
jgi:TolB-like protein